MTNKRNDNFGKMTAKRLASGKKATKQEVYEELMSRRRGRRYFGVIPDSVANYVMPTITGMGTGLIVGNQAGELYRGVQGDNLNARRDGLMSVLGPEIIGTATGGALGLRAGHWRNQRAKQVRERLEDVDDEELKGMLGTRHTALLEKKVPPTPEQIRLKNEEKAREAEVKRKALEQYRANKTANLSAPPNTSKDDIYEELVTRRVEARGESLGRHRLKNFGKDYARSGREFLESMKIPALAATGASALHEYNSSKKRQGYKMSPFRVVAPGIITAGMANTVGLVGGIKGGIDRSKKSYGLSAYSTEELEALLPKNKLRQLYGEHGSEGEELYE